MVERFTQFYLLLAKPKINFYLLLFWRTSTYLRLKRILFSVYVTFLYCIHMTEYRSVSKLRGCMCLMAYKSNLTEKPFPVTSVQYWKKQTLMSILTLRQK